MTITTFTRMDESTADQWAVIGHETMAAQPQVADHVLTLLGNLEGMTVGFAVDQLTHCLQTATLAERDGADDELVVASLCHDVGKYVSIANHPAIAAEILKPFVREDVYHAIRVHQDFQGKHYYAHFGGNPDAREKYVGEPWFDLAAQFADEWDQKAFDPDYDTLPLEHFEPKVRQLFGNPKNFFQVDDTPRKVAGVRVLAACSLGGASHLQTLLPLLDAARDRGDDTMVIAPPGLADMVGRSGHAFQVGGEPPESAIAPIHEQLPILSAVDASVLGNLELFGRLATDAMLPAMEQTVVEWQPDFVLRDPCEYASAVVAVRRGVPLATVAIGLADVEWASIGIAEPALSAHEAGLADALRGAPYVSRFPPSLDASAFGDTRRFRMSAPSSTSPIPDWWDGSEGPLVYASLGTVFGHMTRAAATYRMLIRALAPVDARILLTVGHGFDPAEFDPVPRNLHVERWVDQTDALSDADLVVCHGGSGTAFGALAAGVPLIVVPLFADQRENGRRIEKFGAGMMVESARAPDDNRLLTPHDALRITQSMAAVMASPFYRRRARTLADEMAAAPGAATVLDDLTR